MLYKKYELFYKNFLIILLFYIIGIIVFQSGGTKNAFTHLMYIPIILSSYSYNHTGGILGGLLAGFILSFVPVNIETREIQSNYAILIRSIIFMSVGGLIGRVFYLLKKQYSILENLYKKSSITNLPNRFALIEKIESLDDKDNDKRFLVAVHVDNIMEIFSLIGQSKTELGLQSIALYFQNISGTENIVIYNSHSLKFEFFLEDFDENNVTEWIDSFLYSLKNKPITIDGFSFSISVIMGISKISYKKGQKAINEAYLAVEIAKSNNLIYSFYDDLCLNYYSTTHLISDVDKAIVNGEFYLEYQPKMNLITNKYEEVEALIRWLHPQKGLISPNDFIPKLEKTDKIVALTQWIIAQAVKDIKSWETLGIELNISINVTPRDLREKNFSDNLIKILKSNNISLTRLNIELTETDMIREIDEIIETMLNLQKKGIKISLDDFGTGYSSLSYINMLPIDYVKIDRSLIKDMIKDVKSGYLLENTINLLHNLDKVVVAEGVEDEETYIRLRELGCEEVQGYYISKPLLKKDLERFLLVYNSNLIN